MTRGLPSRHMQSLALYAGVSPTPRATGVQCPESALPHLGRELGSSNTGAELVRLRVIVDATLHRVVGRNDPEYEDLLQSALEGVWGALSVRALGCSHHAQHRHRSAARSLSRTPRLLARERGRSRSPRRERARARTLDAHA